MSDQATAPARLTPRDWGVVALAVLPFLALAVVAIVSVGHGYHGTEDNAMTELRISDIGAHWPTIGPFSRNGWSHPGPALFYLLFVPYRLTGSHSNGLLVGAALVNASAVAGMVVLARRRGGTTLAVLMAIGTLLLGVGLGDPFLWNPWNPFVTVLPFGLAVLLTWCVTCGDAWCLPALVLVGSFCAQTHVGYVPLILVLLFVAAVGLWRHERSMHGEAARTRPVLGPVLVAVGVFVVAWAPPVFQQFTADPGNLSTVWDYFQSGKAAHSVGQAFDIATAQFAWKPGWLAGRSDVNAFTATPISASRTSWPVWWLPFVAAVAWSWRVRHRTARALGAVLTIGVVAAIVAIARTIGPLYEYRLRFVWVLGMLTLTFSVWVAVLAAARFAPVRAWWRVGCAIAVVVTVGLSAYGVVVATRTDLPRVHENRVVASLVPQLLHALPARPGAVIPQSASFAAFVLMNGVMVDLEHHSVQVRVHDNPDDRLRYGDHRVLTNERVRAEIRVAVDDDLEAVASEPCARMLAYWGRVSRSARARAVRAVARIERALAAKRITGPEAFRQLRRWSPDLPAAAVFRTDCP